MKILISLNGKRKPVGTMSKILYPVNEFEVGDEVEIYDRADQLVNIGVVTSVDNGVEIEIVA